jgi:hypothetical protein
VSGYRCKVTPVHADGSVCRHWNAHTGALDPACPGRDGYQATCSCGEDLGTYSSRGRALEDRQAIHLSMHTTRDTHREDR